MEKDNLEYYNIFRSVPQEAQKEIKGGRLKGMTDINPMWRIKKLTEAFGICGFGWYTEINNIWNENGNGGETIKCVSISLYVKVGEEWSKPIIGVGSAMEITKESAGLRSDDEAVKKAYTDAISVSCKALGIGADVYWDKDTDKYTQLETTPKPQKTIEVPYPDVITNDVKIAKNGIDESVKKQYLPNINKELQDDYFNYGYSLYMLAKRFSKAVNELTTDDFIYAIEALRKSDS